MWTCGLPEAGLIYRLLTVQLDQRQLAGFASLANS